MNDETMSFNDKKANVARQSALTRKLYVGNKRVSGRGWKESWDLGEFGRGFDRFLPYSWWLIRPSLTCVALGTAQLMGERETLCALELCVYGMCRKEL